MRKQQIIIILLIIAIAIISIPIFADAGIRDFFGGAKDAILDKGIAAVIAITFGIVAAFFGATKIGKIVLKSRVAVDGLYDILREIRTAKRKDSDGGTAITADEWKAIITKIEQLVVDIIKSFTGKKII